MDNSMGFPIITDKKLQEYGMRGARVRTNFEQTFKKTQAEKQVVRKMKIAHNMVLIKAGHNPKKRMNLSDPMIIKTKIK